MNQPSLVARVKTSELSICLFRDSTCEICCYMVFVSCQSRGNKLEVSWCDNIRKGVKLFSMAVSYHHYFKGLPTYLKLEMTDSVLERHDKKQTRFDCVRKRLEEFLFSDVAINSPRMNRKEDEVLMNLPLPPPPLPSIDELIEEKRKEDELRETTDCCVVEDEVLDDGEMIVHNE